MDQRIQEAGGIIGKLAITNFRIKSPRAREIDQELRTAHDMPQDRWRALIAELTSLCPMRMMATQNIVVLAGRAVVARRLIGDTTYTGAINYGALGTDNTAVNAADTTLGTEVARKLFARRTRTNAQCNFDFFYSQADTDGTYEEFGLFIDGTATVDTGQLFNHALTGGWTKTDTEAMTVSAQININAS
jgi:hypothetical protein